VTTRVLGGQARLFNRATVVVLAHGAAAAWLLARRGTLIVEVSVQLDGCVLAQQTLQPAAMEPIDTLHNAGSVHGGSCDNMLGLGALQVVSNFRQPGVVHVTPGVNVTPDIANIYKVYTHTHFWMSYVCTSCVLTWT
jgi:hypothetical protein